MSAHDSLVVESFRGRDVALIRSLLEPLIAVERQRGRRDIRVHDGLAALGRLDRDGWPARWRDPTYLGDGPYGA